MNWSTPKDGDIRLRTFFCFLPHKVGSQKYWLERITVLEKYFGGTTCGWWRIERIATQRDRNAVNEYWHRVQKEEMSK